MTIQKYITTITLAICFTAAGCSNQATPTATKKSHLGNVVKLEQDYLEFRASHAGVELPPRIARQKAAHASKAATKLTATTPEATAPPKIPATTIVKKKTIQAKPTVRTAKATTPPKIPATTIVKKKTIQAKPTVRTAKATAKQAAPTITTAKQASLTQSSTLTIGSTISHINRQSPLVINTTSKKIIRRRTPSTKISSILSLASRSAHGAIKASEQLGPTALEKLLVSASTEQALKIATHATQKDIALVAEAMRIISLNRPAGKSNTLFGIASQSPSLDVKLLATEAMFIGFRQQAIQTGKRFLNVGKSQRTIRYLAATRILANQIQPLYRRAINNLCYDVSGQKLFDARYAILAAGTPMIGPLVSAAVRYRHTDNAFIARRLFRWIENAGGIDEARFDTFNKNTTPLGIALFAERFGKNAIDILQASQANASHSFKAAIKQALTDLKTNRLNNELPANSTKAFIITYVTKGKKITLLTDKSLLRELPPNRAITLRSQNSEVHFQAIAIHNDQWEKMKTWGSAIPQNLKIAGKTIDYLDID